MTPSERNLVRSVSRSFYLSLKILPESVRSAMALGYVLCRAADTIADTDAVPLENRLDALKKIRDSFGAFPVDVQRLEKALPTSYEGAAAWFKKVSPTEQAFLQNVVLGVIEGMIMDLQTFGDSIENVKAFRTEADLETYIGWIGGEPGRFWTNLLLHAQLFPPSSDRTKLFETGINFGRGLQMVNILKDLPEDLKRGRCYIPEERLKKYGLAVNDLLSGAKKDIFLTLYQEMLDETVKRLENGLFYISQLKPWDLRLRASVWWPLSLGLRTIEQLRKTQDVLAPNAKRKIKRSQVYATMASSVFLPWEKGLRSEFERLS